MVTVPSSLMRIECTMGQEVNNERRKNTPMKKLELLARSCPFFSHEGTLY